ncbi:MAG: methyltransferase domain-containing protein [Candidatus Wallbacteria bacterium]|nr:methyltransferase domain-containing protein [Candidatus Wallbacteria bacterium]
MMDMWKYYHVTHKLHEIFNPLSMDKIRYLVDILQLRPGDRVLDIGCGKAEFLALLAEEYQAECTGLDLSPYFVKAAQQRISNPVLESRVKIVLTAASDYVKKLQEPFRVVSCLGASFAFEGGYKETLQEFVRLVEPGGVAVIGEPYWIREPEPEYLEAIRWNRESCRTYFENVLIGESAGFTLSCVITSSPDDWDRYEGLQWLSASRFAQENSDDKDVREILERTNKEKYAYLKWGRSTLGWAVYVFQKGTV